MKKISFIFLAVLLAACVGLFAGCEQADSYQFKSSELGNYVIVYADDDPDYFELANKLADRIYEKYGVMLTTIPDVVATPQKYEIILGDTIQDDRCSGVMEYSVVVGNGKFKIKCGGAFSAEKAVEFLCKNVFTGKELALDSGAYYQKSLMTKRYEIADQSSVRIMSANILADAFADSSYKSASYRAEIFAGMLVACTPDVVGLQEVDKNWDEVLDRYLTKIQKAYGMTYSRCLDTYEGALNYTSFLYRSDKLTPENSGMQVFDWWTNSTFGHDYHMRNISWVQFASLENSGEKFVVANTHWSYRTEHADGKTYLSGSGKPIATDELRTQCKNETNSFLSQLRQTYPEMPILVTGDFNTSLSFFTQSGWTPTYFQVISEMAKQNGTSASNVPISGHFDHLFGTGKYTVENFAFIKDVNQLELLTDHPIVYADFTFQ